MTIIANLDAAIEQHYAEAGTLEKEIQIFGRVWKLEPVLTTAQLDPLLKIQAAAEIANDNTRDGSREEQMAAIGMVAAFPEIIAMVVQEEQRNEFRKVLRERGIPLQVIPQVMEAIFVTYDAAPFNSEETSSSEPHPTNTPLLESTTDSGSSPANTGQRSSTPSSPSPIDTHLNPPVPQQPVQANPAAQGVPPGLNSVPSPQTASQPYETAVPQTVQ